VLREVFDQTIYEYQDQEFVNHARSWFDSTADLNWTNELRFLRNTGDLEQIDLFCHSVAEYFFIRFITNHADTYLRQHHNNFQQRAVLIGIWPFAMTADLCHATHNHPDSILSGTYYVNVPAGSGALQFHDQLKIQTIVPESGMLLIWPSDMVHSVPKCDFMGTRQAISFDIALAKR
jgi:hypothetical protein